MEAIVIITALVSVGAWGAVILQPKLKKLRRKVRPKSRARGRRPAAKSRTAKQPPAHDYRQCQDGKCKARLCQVFREGRMSCTLPHLG